MSHYAVSVRAVGKRYQLGGSLVKDTLRDHIASAFARLVPKRAPAPASAREFLWALREVSFDVSPGEVMGVIGRNGAGKSTLLKILSQITDPTEGEIRLRGRVASLLEVGTGFHPELSGRENIFLNAAILGMRRTEIVRKLDEIVAFAEVEKFLDTPVKHYSSGMYVRLAFAVAVHLDPEILIVDEVLAVGDAAFQAKCLGKMDSVASREGRTVLFVSHNLAAIQRLCTRAVLLEGGRVRALGAVADTLDRYQRSFEAADAAAEAKPGGPVTLVDWELDGGGHASESGAELTAKIRVRFHEPVAGAFFGAALWDASGELILADSMRVQDQYVDEVAPGWHELRVRTRLPLKPGLYSWEISASARGRGLMDRVWVAPKLHILPRSDRKMHPSMIGILNEPIHFAFGPGSEKGGA
jgi:lipopolysaccharide transport system ATP-binding protein